MKRKIVSFLIIMSLFTGLLPLNFNIANAENLSFTKLKDVDKGSFNEYGYKITKSFFKLKEVFEVDYVIDSKIANELLDYVEKAYKYLPDDLNNETKYSKARIALRKGLKYPNNDVYFENIRKSLESFIEKAKIQKVTGNIIATPNEGNAPLISTLRAEIEDPSGTKIGKSSYIWWINVSGKKQIIGKKPSISYTFTEEGTYSVFLDVKSSHKNSFGNIDVLPYSGSVKIKVKEKIASVILRVSGNSINLDNEIKFSPEIAKYGLIFDATSSTASSGTKFIKTTWNFGNGVKKSYNGGPKIERIIYSKEGNFDVKLELSTNQGKKITKKFKVMVHKPIASIKVNKDEGFIGDKFNFRAQSHGNTKFLSYYWEVINTKKDKILIKKSGNILLYSFKEKGEFSVKLKITDAAGNVDIDTKTIYINSRAPIANFKSNIPFSNKPNKVYFDATESFDPDFDDDGNLKYSWTIDGQKINLEESNDNGSTGFYTFSTTGDHSVILEVEDLDEITSTLRNSIKINSTLDLDFAIFPRVALRKSNIRFIAESKEAKFYTWDFGDGDIKSKAGSKITHSYSKSGIFPVKLTVQGKNRTHNTYIQNVYIGDSKNPVSVINLSRQGAFNFKKENKACSGKTAYIVSRKDSLIFSGKDSIDTNGENTGLSYSWVIGQGKYKTGQNITERFDELGCYRIKLTVKSKKDKTTALDEIWVKVKNLEPTISSLKITPVDLNTDPVIVKVSALGTKDPDGVIQSYLWYYTTDIDNEAQDFRITKIPNTTFVIPKIQGTYYFGVMMKDNNGAKVNSEDLVNKIGNNFIELQGDNSNTPLIDFSTSKSSIAIGEEITFRALAKNIRGDSIEKSAKFSWDFNGDGFYDKETEKGTIKYKYKKSGTFYPKVKIRNKGFSNTRTLTINVSNRLSADFKYTSIGNKVIFVNKSVGTIEKNTWDFGDGDIQKNKDYIVHQYDDKKNTHNVQLTVVEGEKVKKITKDVEKNIRNVLKSRKKGLNIFSFPEANNKGEIILEEEENVFIYLGESKGNFKYYGIDYNINRDGNLDGGKDNDIDNKNSPSYQTGNPEKIILDSDKKQTIRLLLIDENGTTVNSKDLTIIKNYIEDSKEVKIKEFSGVTEEEKIKIENLKIEISKLPQENKLKGMQYIQKLQESWSDETEKVRTIIDFERFIDSTGLDQEKSDKIIDILYSFITEDSSDEKEVAFQALKSLIPNDIQCSVESGTCKELIEKKLTEIKNSLSVENNRAISKEVLGYIQNDKSMTKNQKNDFKGILKILVYSSVNKIPDTEKKEQLKDDDITKPKVEQNEDGKLIKFLKSIGWWIAGIVGVIFVLMFVFWIMDFLKNRKSGETFEDFVDNSTEDVLDVSDPLDMNEQKKEGVIEEPIKEEEKVSAIFSDNINDNKEEKLDILENKEEKNTEEVTIKEDDISNNSENNSTEEIPDWLSGSLENTDNEKEDEKSIEKNKKEEEDKYGFSLDDGDEEKEINKEEIIENDNNSDDKNKVIDNSEKNKEEINEEVDLEDITKIDDEVESNTPDWLKESLSDKLPKKDENKEKELDFEEEESNEEEKSELNDIGDDVDLDLDDDVIITEDKKEEELNLDTDEDIPDWLKDDAIKTDENKKETAKKNTTLKKEMGESNSLDKEDVPDWLKESLVEKEETKEDVGKKETKKEKDKKETEEKVKTKKNKKNKINKEEKKENELKKSKKDDELWDDGMTIPDWLKND